MSEQPKCKPVWGSCELPSGHLGQHSQTPVTDLKARTESVTQRWNQRQGVLEGSALYDLVLDQAQQIATLTDDIDILKLDLAETEAERDGYKAQVAALTAARGNGVLVPGPELEKMRGQIATLTQVVAEEREDASQWMREEAKERERVGGRRRRLL